jgi:hypothetical protein
MKRFAKVGWFRGWNLATAVAANSALEGSCSYCAPPLTRILACFFQAIFRGADGHPIVIIKYVVFGCVGR